MATLFFHGLSGPTGPITKSSPPSSSSRSRGSAAPSVRTSSRGGDGVRDINEANDFRVEIWPDPGMQFGEAAKDVVLTMFIPTLKLSTTDDGALPRKM